MATKGILSFMCCSIFVPLQLFGDGGEVSGSRLLTLFRDFFFSDILIRKSSVNMERVGKNIFRGGGAEIFKTCVCSGWGEGALQTDDRVTKRGEGAPKMFLDVNSVTLTYE